MNAPLNTAALTGFLRLPQVLSLIPVSRASFYAGIKSGIYPAPCRLGSLRSVGWKADDIRLLIEEIVKTKGETRP